LQRLLEEYAFETIEEAAMAASALAALGTRGHDESAAALRALAARVESECAETRPSPTAAARTGAPSSTPPERWREGAAR
jgi:hypothetical protein